MEEKTLKINNLEFNCQTLIEFSSLINALLEMAKKQKETEKKLGETEKKLGEHELKINNLIKLISTLQKEPKETGIGWQDKENELSNILNDEHIFSMNYNNSNLSNFINNETLNEAPKQNNNIFTNKIEEKEIIEEKSHQDDKTQEKPKEKSIPNLTEPNIEIKEKTEDKKEQKQIILNDNKANENQIIKRKEEVQSPNIINNINNIKDSNTNNIIVTEKKQEPVQVQKHVDKSNKNTEIISKMFQRIVLLEKKVTELISKSGDNMIIRTLNTNKQSINDHTDRIKKLVELTENLNKEVIDIKEKMKDFNLYDMFKDGEDGNVDITKALIKALETKHNKRLDLLDEKYKYISTESFKNKDDIKNLGIVLDGQKKSLEKNNEKIKGIIEDQKNKEIKEQEEREKQSAEINKKFEDVNKNLEDFGDNYDNKLLELENKLSQQQKQPVLVTDIKQEKKKEPRKSENFNLLKEYNERILELEKSMRQLLKKLNIDELNSNLSILQKEITKKGNQGAIDEITDRLYSVDETIKQLSYRIDSSQAFEKKALEENSNLSKKLETFGNQVNRLSLQFFKNNKEEKPC